MNSRKKSFLALCFFCVASLAVLGCESTGENTKRGAIGGALLGSIAGGVIGHQSGHGVAGALIGGGVGAIGGGLIGDKIDARSKDQILTSGEKLGISDVIVLAKSGIGDDAIVDKIAKTGSVYNLSVEEIEALRKEGVSSRVLNYMLNTTKK
jgi:uncharacterized membrane protein